MNKFIICPNCLNKMKFYLNEWGYTPWHLHCKVCNINIGTNNQKKNNRFNTKISSPRNID